MYFWYCNKGHRIVDCENDECEYCAFLPKVKQLADQKYGEGCYFIFEWEEETIFEYYPYYKCIFIPY
jgi:hypothetical protein